MDPKTKRRVALKALLQTQMKKGMLLALMLQGFRNCGMNICIVDKNTGVFTDQTLMSLLYQRKKKKKSLAIVLKRSENERTNTITKDSQPEVHQTLAEYIGTRDNRVLNHGQCVALISAHINAVVGTADTLAKKKPAYVKSKTLLRSFISFCCNKQSTFSCHYGYLIAKEIPVIGYKILPQYMDRCCVVSDTICSVLRCLGVEAAITIDSDPEVDNPKETLRDTTTKKGRTPIHASSSYRVPEVDPLKQTLERKEIMSPNVNSIHIVIKSTPENLSLFNALFIKKSTYKDLMFPPTVKSMTVS